MTRTKLPMSPAWNSKGVSARPFCFIKTLPNKRFLKDDGVVFKNIPRFYRAPLSVPYEFKRDFNTFEDAFFDAMPCPPQDVVLKEGSSEHDEEKCLCQDCVQDVSKFDLKNLLSDEPSVTRDIQQMAQGIQIGIVGTRNSVMQAGRRGCRPKPLSLQVKKKKLL